MRRILRYIIIPLSVLAGIFFSAPFLLIGYGEGRAWIQETILEHYGFIPTVDEDTVVEAIITGKRKPADCDKIVHVYRVLDFTPSVGELRANCVYKAAQKLKDPAVCQMLLPDEYALSCMGDVEERSIADMHATAYYDVLPENHCERIKDHPLHRDRCFEGRAFKAHDPMLCAPITNPTIRAACTLELTAWVKYPDLRTSAYFGKYRQQL